MELNKVVKEAIDAQQIQNEIARLQTDLSKIQERKGKEVQNIELRYKNKIEALQKQISIKQKAMGNVPKTDMQNVNKKVNPFTTGDQTEQ